MTKRNNKPFNNVSRQKKVLVVTGILVSVFAGMFMTIVAIDNFKNYLNPYVFGFVFGTVGLLAGLFVARKIKSAIVINQKMQQNYAEFTLFILTGFIGLFLLAGQKANAVLSIKEKCDNYSVVDKVFKPGGHKQAELNIFVINIDGVQRRYITKPNYWQTISIGEQIHVCIYKSIIGFDYLKLANEN